MSNTDPCGIPGCVGGPFADAAAARRHRHQYHSLPVPFVIGGQEYIVSHSNNRYGCPLPQCGKYFKKRDGIQTHIVGDHNGNSLIKIFDTSATSSAMHRGPGESSGVVLVPATPLSEGILLEGPVGATTPSASSATVTLEPSADYLKSNEVLDLLGVALTSSMVAGHRKNHHQGYQVSPSALQSFLDFCSQANIYEKPEFVKPPTPRGPPVQFILPPTSGFVCRSSSNCIYSVKDLPTMQRHCREKHNAKPLVEIEYQSCLVQRLFTAVGNSYFEVRDDLMPGSRPDLRTSLKGAFLPALDASLVVPADTERERTPLVRCMGWDKFMPDIRMDPKQRRAADDLKKKHTAEEYDGVLNRLADAVSHHFEKASTILDGHPHKLSLCKILVHGRNVPREVDTYWKPVSDSNENYPRFMVQLTRSMIRIYLGYPLQFSFALSDQQSHSLDRLVNVLQDDTATRRCRMLAYHELAWSLVDADLAQCQMSWSNPIQRAIWLKALRSDALLDKDQDTDNVHADDFDRVARVHERVLSLGRPTTFNMLYEMQQYASSLAFSQTQEPKVFVDPDFKWISIGKEKMVFDKLRGGIRELINTAKLRYAALTDNNTILTQMPDHVKDDLTNTTRGYSFASEDLFHKKRHSLFLFLVEEHGLAMVDNEGRIAWNIPAIKDFLRRSLRAWEPLYHLLYVTTHISCRGTQFVDHQISNADRHRNIFMQGQEMFILTGYSKKTSLTDRDSCIPGFVPQDVMLLTLEMLGGGLRTAESILAGVAYGKEAEHAYRTYLCVGEGERITPERFSANISHWNFDCFGCRWGLRDFRQGAITMGREFISPNDSFDEADSILAESADHSTGTDHAHYAGVHGVMPRLSNNTISKQRWLGDQWHSFLGLGPYDPQEPIRKMRRNAVNGARGIDVQAISDQVGKITTDLLASFFTNDVKTVIRDAVSASFQDRGRMPYNVSDIFKDCSSGNVSEVKAIRSRASSISYGSLLSNSPLPASSIPSLSNPASPIMTPSPGIVPTSDPREMTPVKKWKGKGRAVDVASPPGLSTVLKSLKGKEKAKANSVVSLSSSPPVAPMAYRKRLLEKVSETDEDEERSRSLKRFRPRSMPVPEVDMETISVSSDDDNEVDSSSSLSSFIFARRTPLSSPPAAVKDARQSIREAIRYLRKEPAAMEKSRAQMDALVAVMTDPNDIVIAMKTGGGKSILWMVPPALDDEVKVIVVCPFVALLDEQYHKTAASGLRCHNYCHSKDVKEDVQVLFVQVEHCSSEAFAGFLESPLGNKFKKVFVDEFHDIMNCHPDRVWKWRYLAEKFSEMSKQIILLSATAPPHRLDSFIAPYQIARRDLTVVRSSTNRPEIGMHVVHVPPMAAKQALAHLVRTLNQRLGDEERMLVFFASQGDAEGFALSFKCAVYHSELWVPGNTKADNLDLWDRGESKVMACTTAFAQGIDRSTVRYVVIFRPSYGLLVNNQMLGRAGRDNKESHVFFVTEKGRRMCVGDTKEHKDQCTAELQEVVYGEKCRRYSNTMCMDGEYLARRCNEKPRGIPCDVCAPDSEMQLLALKAIEHPLRSLDGAGTADETKAKGASALQQNTPAGFIAASALVKTTAEMKLKPAQPLSQESDTYDMDSQISSSQARMLDALEDLHQPASQQAGSGTKGSSGGPLANCLEKDHETASRFDMMYWTDADGCKSAKDIEKSSSQPSAGRTSWVEAPPPSSLPLPNHSGGFSSRAGRANEAAQSRLGRTARLNRGERVSEEKHRNCEAMRELPMELYRAFKYEFTFEPYTYCFHCCLPQSRNRNGEGPACHGEFKFEAGNQCPFKGFIFKAVFSMWHREGFRELMIRDIGGGGRLSTFEEFLGWVTQEDRDEGKYNNCVEAFLWFCGEIEAAKARFFD
ncbi:hypothetical protein DFH29DRAFT_882371 [Suillus ampliporus]|nr:hypothetical protein DFH29DRAFT_882371 [Suillus ampliporus]